MFVMGEVYMYQLQTKVIYVGETPTHYIFKGETTEYVVSKKNNSIRKPFKFIKV